MCLGTHLNASSLPQSTVFPWGTSSWYRARSIWYSHLHTLTNSWIWDVLRTVFSWRGIGYPANCASTQSQTARTGTASDRSLLSNPQIVWSSCSPYFMGIIGYVRGVPSFRYPDIILLVLWCVMCYSWLLYIYTAYIYIHTYIDPILFWTILYTTIYIYIDTCTYFPACYPLVMQHGHWTKTHFNGHCSWLCYITSSMSPFVTR